jgi:YD repeat-containing protein
VTTNDAVTNYDYGPLNRLTKITDALAGITQYAYNGVDQLVSVTDPKTLLTSYAVDGLDNQKQLVSPDTGTTNRTFDAAGNLKTSTDARSKASTYSYDALNRVTGVTFSCAFRRSRSRWHSTTEVVSIKLQRDEIPKRITLQFSHRYARFIVSMKAWRAAWILPLRPILIAMNVPVQ